jgi:DNA-binding PadR family transcriptional regulator
MTNLTPTSYAILGLLAVRPYSTYEIATQVERTIRRFWPRARSKLYEEPKKLVAAGLAVAAKDAHGRRPRTVYSITPAGRDALAAWLATDSAEPSLESEHILKIFYGDSGTTANLRDTLNGLRAWAAAVAEHNVAMGTFLLDRKPPYPDRLALLVLTGRFLDDYVEMVDRWAIWALGMIEPWPDDPRRAVPDRAELEVTIRQAAARAERWRADQPVRAADSAPRNASA